jgi:hypothetical protein
MTTLGNAYDSEDTARSWIAALETDGVPGRDIRLLVGAGLDDVRCEPVGGFAGPVYPDDPVGSFGNQRLRRPRGNGTFCGDADRQRQGTFGDSDRHVIVSREHVRVAGDAGDPHARFAHRADAA